MRRGACRRNAGGCVGGLRAVLWQWAGGGLPLPQAKAPPTVRRRMIHIGPEPWEWGSGSFALRGGSRKMAVALLNVHTPLEKSAADFTDTSIHRLVSQYMNHLGLRLPSAQKTILVTFVVTLERRGAVE